jgi:hypothetical protein
MGAYMHLHTANNNFIQGIPHTHKIFAPKMKHKKEKRANLKIGIHRKEERLVL